MYPPALPDDDLKFDAPVEGAAFSGAVIGNGARFAVTGRGHAAGLDLMTQDQVAFDDFGTALGEAEVIEFGADGVRMAFDFGGEAGGILEFLGGFID